MIRNSSEYCVTQLNKRVKLSDTKVSCKRNATGESRKVQKIEQSRKKILHYAKTTCSSLPRLLLRIPDDILLFVVSRMRNIMEAYCKARGDLRAVETIEMRDFLVQYFVKASEQKVKDFLQEFQQHLYDFMQEHNFSWTFMRLWNKNEIIRKLSAQVLRETLPLWILELYFLNHVTVVWTLDRKQYECTLFRVPLRLVQIHDSSDFLAFEGLAQSHLGIRARRFLYSPTMRKRIGENVAIVTPVAEKSRVWPAVEAQINWERIFESWCSFFHYFQFSVLCRLL